MANLGTVRHRYCGISICQEVVAKIAGIDEIIQRTFKRQEERQTLGRQTVRAKHRKETKGDWSLVGGGSDEHGDRGEREQPPRLLT